MTQTLIDILLFLCLVAAPLMYASVEPWAEIPLALVSLVTFNLALAVRPRALGTLVRCPWVWLGAGMLALILFQLIPFPSEIIRRISPSTFAFYDQYFPNGITPGTWLTLSIYPSATLNGLIQFLTYAFVFLTVLIRMLPSEERRHPEERSDEGSPAPSIATTYYASGDPSPRPPAMAGETGAQDDRRLKKSQYLMLGCLAGVLSLLFHSLYDFNLHITANGIYFVTLLALGTGAAQFKRHPDNRRHPERSEGSPAPTTYNASGDPSACGPQDDNRRHPERSEGSPSVFNYDHTFLRRAVNFIIVFGFLVALQAIIQKFSYTGRIYWMGIQAQCPVGPYYNYDHFAGFMEMCSAVAVSMVMASIFHTSFFERKGFSKKALWFATAEANNTLRYVFLSVVMISTIFLSTSRGGIMSFTLAMLIFFLVVVRVGWRVGKTKRAGVLMVMICLLITVMVTWLGPEPFLKRFHLLSLNKIIKMEGPIGDRLLFYKETLNVVRDFPQVGTGLNTFATTFTRYRSFDYTMNLLSYTHNDYLQIVSETGAGGVMFFMGFFGLYGVYARRVIRRLE